MPHIIVGIGSRPRWNVLGAMTTPTRQRMMKGKPTMNIVPTRIQEQINGVDRNQSLVYGIFGAISAFFCIWKLFWLHYAAIALSGVGLFTLTLSLVTYGAIGALGVFVAIAFLTRYAKQP
jgi:hypothetical protein